MMNSHLQYSAATMYQKDLLARSARRQLARTVRDQARLALQEASAELPATKISAAAASAPSTPPVRPDPDRAAASGALRVCRTAGQH